MAYHSTMSPGVYHECKNCTVGNNIERQYLREGKPGAATLCQQCDDKQKNKSCTWGTPTPAR